MYSKKAFTQTLNKLGDYELNLRSFTDPRGRKYYSGFITNEELGLTVYVTSESFYNPHCDYKFCIRYARRVGDYNGGMNHFVKPENTPFMVHTFLQSPNMFREEFCK
jgi:hypothetical protein